MRRRRESEAKQAVHAPGCKLAVSGCSACRAGRLAGRSGVCQPDSTRSMQPASPRSQTPASATAQGRTRTARRPACRWLAPLTLQLVHSGVVGLPRPDGAAHVRQAVGVNQVCRLVRPLWLDAAAGQAAGRAREAHRQAPHEQAAAPRPRRRPPQARRQPLQTSWVDMLRLARCKEAHRPGRAAPQAVLLPLILDRVRGWDRGDDLGIEFAKGAARLPALGVRPGAVPCRVRRKVHVPGGWAGRACRGLRTKGAEKQGLRSTQPSRGSAHAGHEMRHGLDIPSA